jgi:hypothetical protein
MAERQLIFRIELSYSKWVKTSALGLFFCFSIKFKDFWVDFRCGLIYGIFTIDPSQVESSRSIADRSNLSNSPLYRL